MIRTGLASGVAVLALGLLAAPASAAPRRNEPVYAAVEANRPWALALLKSMVNIDSGTGDVAGGQRIIALLTPKLQALGADVRTEPAEAPGLPDNLVAVFHGTGRGKILIVAHMDTVFGPGTAAGRPFSITPDGRAHGPGVGDEKAGDVNAITALKILHDLGFNDYRTITLLIDDSEERGSPGSTQLIRRLSRESDVEFNMEPGDEPDVITVWRKGATVITLDVKGRAAHAGMAPQDGRNAATELIHQIGLIDGVFPHSGDQTTVNLTLMSAGDRNNIIPKDASASFSVRYRSQAAFEAVLAKMQADAQTTAVPDTTVTVSHTPSFPPLTENAPIDALAGRAQAIYAELGKTVGTGGNGGASESAIAMAEGTPALDGLGYVGGGFHTDHEWIELGSVTPRLYLFARLLMEVGGESPAALMGAKNA